MYKIMIPLVLAALTTLLLAVPITDKQNQRNALFPSIGYQNNNNNNNMNNARMSPIHIRDRTGLDCSEPGFFVNPTNCSRFYRCVDVASTGYFSIFNFECSQGLVFYQDSLSCVPGVSCSPVGSPSPGQGSPVGPPSPGQGSSVGSPSPGQGSSVGSPSPGQGSSVGSPSPGQGSSVGSPSPGQGSSVGSPSPGQGSSPPNSPVPMNPPVQMNPPVTSPPSPPPPPPPSPPTPVTQQVTVPQWFNELPPWFKESPWWFNTAPSWFSQAPAWFNAQPSAHVITEDIYIDDSEPNGPHIDVAIGTKPGKITKHITTDGNISMGGIDNSLLHDNKTIRIHIPIHIVQQ